MSTSERIDGVESAGQGGSDEDQLEGHRTVEDVKDGGRQVVPAQAVLQVPPQHPQGTVVWERFLHLRSIKVLLVENDDSTRHVVTALLRNCNYEVVEASSSLQAWKILEDLTNHIDLILTEVVMPCFSGIGLLCKIMSHKTRKNVPIIMMSSHDSMGLVFKCLSKGAVDFLVKPIRKNELKNLWQHVWRRCHSSSSSGSGSASLMSSSEKSGNNNGSNDGNDNGSSSLNVGDGTDGGSGTQSSWTKQVVEVDSRQAVSPWDKVAECPDSTCAQVICPSAKASVNKCLPPTATRECPDPEELLDRVARGSELGHGQTINRDLQHEQPIEVLAKDTGRKQKKFSVVDSNTFIKDKDKGLLDPNGESSSSENKVDFTNLSDVQADSREHVVPKGLAKGLELENKSIDDSKEILDTQLSLNRLREIRDAGKTVHDELSAFSRYNIASKAPYENMGGSFGIDYSMDGGRKELLCSVLLLYRHSIVMSNGIDMDSTTDKDSATPVVFKDKSKVTSAGKDFHQSPALERLRADFICTPQQAIVKADDKAARTVLSPPWGSCQELPSQHLHHHFNHFKKEQQQPPPNYVQQSCESLAVNASYCESSSGPVEGNIGHYSLNRSALGSNHGSNHGSNQGSNGQNGSSTAVDAGVMNLESVNVLAGNSGSGDASGNGSGDCETENKLAQRKAALIKFRQKRKERCFQKKVRYPSRKRLAEKRARVRGQFVGQSDHETSSSAADESLHFFTVT